MQSCSNLSVSDGEWNRFCRHGVVAAHTLVKPSVCMDEPSQQINVKRHVNHHPLTPSIKLPELLAINHAFYSSPISWRPCRSSSTPLSKSDHQGAA